MEVKDLKRVTIEVSNAHDFEKLQLKLFDLGFVWVSSGKKLLSFNEHANENYISIYETNCLYLDDMGYSTQIHNCRLIDLNDVLNIGYNMKSKDKYESVLKIRRY